MHPWSTLFIFSVKTEVLNPRRPKAKICFALKEGWINGGMKRWNGREKTWSEREKFYADVLQPLVGKTLNAWTPMRWVLGGIYLSIRSSIPSRGFMYTRHRQKIILNNQLHTF